MKTSIQDIVKNDLCTGCGACISESGNAFEMRWDEYGFLVPHLRNNHVLSDNAIRVCPFNTDPEEEVKDEDKLAEIFLKEASNYDEQIGRFQNIYVGYSNLYRETSSSGGLATYVFEQLLKRGIVDHLFVVKEVAGTYEYQFFSSVEAILNISKTRYIPVTLERLFAQIDTIDGKIAVSGVACFLKAIRLKQHYHPELKVKISFLVGIICGGWKSRFFTEYMAQKSGIQGTYTRQDYRIKDFDSKAINYSFGAYDEQSQLHQIKVSKIGDLWGSGLFKANACDFCDDVATELADISLGDAWINPYSNDGRGTSVIVTRSSLADDLIKSGMGESDLSVNDLTLEQFKSSQAGSFKHRQMGLKYRLDKMQKAGRLIPQKRKRFFQMIPFEFKAVQKQRMLVRCKSLNLWKESNNSSNFDHHIAKAKSDLVNRTKWYRRIQKIRKKLHLRTM